jgi:hypothetical protein
MNSLELQNGPLQTPQVIQSPVHPVPLHLGRNEVFQAQDVGVVRQQLEPADRGPRRGGYLVLLSSLKLSYGVTIQISMKIIFQILLLTCQFQGSPLSFGIFQNYYSGLPQFANNSYILIVGTVASGISYLGAPLVTPVIKRYLKYKRQVIMVGCKTLFHARSTC